MTDQYTYDQLTQWTVGKLAEKVGRLVVENDRLQRSLAACGRLCAEVQDWADRLADGDTLTLSECQEFSSRCGHIAQKWMPPPTAEELAWFDEHVKKSNAREDEKK